MTDFAIFIIKFKFQLRVTDLLYFIKQIYPTELKSVTTLLKCA